MESITSTLVDPRRDQLTWASSTDVRAALYRSGAVWLEGRRVRLHGQRGTLHLVARGPHRAVVFAARNGGRTYVVHLTDLEYLKDGWGVSTLRRKLTRAAVVSTVAINIVFALALLKDCAG